MNRFETPHEVFVVTGDFGQPGDSVAVPYAPSYLETPETPKNPMDFPTLHTYGVAPSYEQATPEDQGYGLDLSGYKSYSPSDMDVYFVWPKTQAEPLPTDYQLHTSETQLFPEPATEQGPEYLDRTGVDYEFTGPASPEQAIQEFREWAKQNPGSTPRDPIHRERLTDLYETIDSAGHVAAAAALKAARRARINEMSGEMASREADPTRTSFIKVADVLGGIAAQQLANEGDNVSAEPAAASTADQPAAQSAPQGARHAAGRGRHRRR